MLRLSSDRILVALAPDSLSFVRLEGVFRPRVSDKGTIACDPAFGAEPWQGAVAALARPASAPFLFWAWRCFAAICPASCPSTAASCASFCM